jgi:hypothetical protein
MILQIPANYLCQSSVTYPSSYPNYIMKTLTAFSFLVALSFLMVSVGSGSARLNAPCPCDLRLSLDTSFLTHNFNEGTITPDTVRGSIQDMSSYGARFTVKISAAAQWVIVTKIRGNVVQDGDIIKFASDETLPIEIIIVPYAERPDTESYCLSILWDGTISQGTHCMTLAMTNTPSAVSPDLQIPNITIAPNPAGDYISVRGLNSEMATYRYELFSISGADVRHGILHDDAHISVEDLPSGTYRLLLSDGKRTISNTAITVLH